MECFFDLMVSLMYVLMIHASRNEMRERDIDTELVILWLGEKQHDQQNI